MVFCMDFCENRDNDTQGKAVPSVLVLGGFTVSDRLTERVFSTQKYLAALTHTLPSDI